MHSGYLVNISDNNINIGRKFVPLCLDQSFITHSSMTTMSIFCHFYQFYVEGNYSYVSLLLLV